MADTTRKKTSNLDRTNFLNGKEQKHSKEIVKSPSPGTKPPLPPRPAGLNKLPSEKKKAPIERPPPPKGTLKQDAHNKTHLPQRPQQPSVPLHDQNSVKTPADETKVVKETNVTINAEKDISRITNEEHDAIQVCNDDKDIVKVKQETTTMTKKIIPNASSDIIQETSLQVAAKPSVQIKPLKPQLPKPYSEKPQPPDRPISSPKMMGKTFSGKTQPEQPHTMKVDQPSENTGSTPPRPQPPKVTRTSSISTSPLTDAVKVSQGLSLTPQRPNPPQVPETPKTAPPIPKKPQSINKPPVQTKKCQPPSRPKFPRKFSESLKNDKDEKFAKAETPIHGHIPQENDLGEEKSLKVKKPIEGHVSKENDLKEEKVSDMETPSEGYVSKENDLTEEKASDMETPSEGHVSKENDLTEEKASDMETPSEGHVSKENDLTEEKTSDMETPSEGHVSKKNDPTEEESQISVKPSTDDECSSYSFEDLDCPVIACSGNKTSIMQTLSLASQDGQTELKKETKPIRPRAPPRKKENVEDDKNSPCLPVKPERSADLNSGTTESPEALRIPVKSRTPYRPSKPKLPASKTMSNVENNKKTESDESHSKLSPKPCRPVKPKLSASAKDLEYKSLKCKEKPQRPSKPNLCSETKLEAGKNEEENGALSNHEVAVQEVAFKKSGEATEVKLAKPSRPPQPKTPDIPLKCEQSLEVSHLGDFTKEENRVERKENSSKLNDVEAEEMVGTKETLNYPAKPARLFYQEEKASDGKEMTNNVANDKVEQTNSEQTSPISNDETIPFVEVKKRSNYEATPDKHTLNFRVSSLSKTEVESFNNKDFLEKVQNKIRSKSSSDAERSMKPVRPHPPQPNEKRKHSQGHGTDIIDVTSENNIAGKERRTSEKVDDSPGQEAVAGSGVIEFPVKKKKRPAPPVPVRDERGSEGNTSVLIEREKVKTEKKKESEIGFDESGSKQDNIESLGSYGRLESNEEHAEEQITKVSEKIADEQEIASSQNVDERESPKTKKKAPPPKPKRTSSLKRDFKPIVKEVEGDESNSTEGLGNITEDKPTYTPASTISDSEDPSSSGIPEQPIFRSKSFAASDIKHPKDPGKNDLKEISRSFSFGGKIKWKRQSPRSSPPTFFLSEETDESAITNPKAASEEQSKNDVIMKQEKIDVIDDIKEQTKTDVISDVIDEHKQTDVVKEQKKTNDIEEQNKNDVIKEEEKTDVTEERKSGAVEEISKSNESLNDAKLDSCLTTDSESENEKEVEPQKSKTYYISREILSTERTFVDVVKLVAEDFREAVKQGNARFARPIIPEDALQDILLNISQIYEFDREFLKALELRMETWDEEQRIGDIIKRFSPFLKMYKTYIEGYDNAMMLLTDALKKYPQFAEVVREFELSERCQNLTVGMYMLKPIQRIPSYRLLLKDYLKHLSQDSLDHEDVSDALTIVSEVATHINEDMKRVDNFEEVLKVQRSLVGQVEIVKPGRELIKEGALMKLCRKDMQPRMFYLFTDVLLYTRPVANNQFSLLLCLPLEEIKVEIPVSPDFDNEFSIISTKKSFILSASTADERDEWLEALRNASDEIRKKKITFHLAKKEKMEALYENEQQHEDKATKLGSKAPVWIPDVRVSMCMICTDDFTVTNRRHHCRACGKVVCGSCSSNSAPLAYLNGETARVCDVCFDELTTSLAQKIVEESEINIQRKDSAPKINPLKKSKRKAKSMEVPAVEESIISGYLKTRVGKKWYKRWYVVKDNVLYASKASSDVAAQETRPLLGYDVRGPEKMDGDNKKLVFQLIHAGTEPVVLQTDNIKSAERWVNALRRATILPL